MPGPKMGPRPKDFNEELIRKAPTFQRWLKLQPGQKLTYACREFTKGADDDEERLMRRIMIARRNNLKDHAVLKRARAAEAVRRGVEPAEDLGKKRTAPEKQLKVEEDLLAGIIGPGDGSEIIGDAADIIRPASPSNPSGTKRRRVAGTIQPTDEEVLMEMDVPAVEATRSYRKWLALPHGAPFTYNQRYIKGKEDHDWLLKKNIWRRMRYRRENRVKVEEMMVQSGEPVINRWSHDRIESATAGAASAAVANNVEDHTIVSRAVVDAAAAAAAQVEAFQPGIDADAVAALGADDPIVSCALDAAAQLAAAAVAGDHSLPTVLATAAAEAPVEDNIILGEPPVQFRDSVVDDEDNDQVEVQIAV